MPEIVAFHHLSLSVTDLARSTQWYADVMGFDVVAEIEGDGFRRTRLRSPNGDVTLALTAHDVALGESFDERRAGMDHVAFQLAAGDIEAFESRLQALGVVHSEIRSGASGNFMVTFRDPDNIQLEAFAEPLPAAPRRTVRRRRVIID